MKCLIILAAILITACSGTESADIELTDIEMCLDQGGEWQGECAYPGEYCLVRASCKPEAEFCSCEQWGIKE